MKLIFIYNANTGVVNKALDFAHKMFSPGTYACNLCALTYGNFGAHTEWVTFIKSLNMPVEFVYKNNFVLLKPEMKIDFPAILISKNDDYSLLISKKELNEMSNLNDLIKLIQTKLNLIAE